VNSFILPFNVPPSSIRVSHSTNLFFVGSCFSDEISKLALLHGLNAVSNPFGTIFHPIPIANNLLNSINNKSIDNEIIQSSDLYLSSFLSSKIYDHSKEQLTDKIIKIRHQVVKDLKHSDVLFITFGTSWGYRSKINNELVANCHKLPQDKFTKELSEVEIMYNVWSELLHIFKREFPQLKVVFTISPVRHSKDGLIENNRSKSRLFELVHLLCEKYNVEYFPSYEIILDELRDYRFYKTDRVHPTDEAVSYVWDKFMNCFLSKDSIELCREVLKVKKGLSHVPIHSDSIQSKKHKIKISSKIKDLSKECPSINWE
tara:strand:- start:1713 stop:2660 length:948 start_codon:yes stop_codon:yes gene_type:complete